MAIVNLTKDEFLFPAESFAHTVTLCGPNDKELKVVFAQPGKAVGPVPSR